MSPTTERVLAWSPTPRQEMFLTCPAKEVVFGGARGGGKSDGIVGDWLAHSDTYGRAAKALLVRRKQKQLDDLIDRMRTVFEPLGADYVDHRATFHMPGGAVLRCRYLDSERDADEYQGHSYTRVYPEELTNFSSFVPIGKLLATCRSARGVPAQMKATCNPGGVGHLWVKGRYIDIAPPFTPYSDNAGKTYRVYIPSRLEDNPMMDDPEGYKELLKLAGSPALVRAWLTGDWNIVEGAFFPEFDQQTHVIPAARIPAHWLTRFRAMDWGSARPYCCLWIAVADGNTPPEWPFPIPRGALVVYRELYGWGGEPNKGTRETAPEVGRKIVMADEDDVIVYSKLDPATFAQNGGPSIAEMMARNGAWFDRADNTRVGRLGASSGWDQIRQRLRGLDGEPMLYIMDNCRHLLRTLPVLPADPIRLDDVDTDSEDHAADALRYGCSSRPFIGLPYTTPFKQLPIAEQVRQSSIITLGDPNDAHNMPRDWDIPRMTVM